MVEKRQLGEHESAAMGWLHPRGGWCAFQGAWHTSVEWQELFAIKPKKAGKKGGK